MIACILMQKPAKLQILCNISMSIARVNHFHLWFLIGSNKSAFFPRFHRSPQELLGSLSANCFKSPVFARTLFFPGQIMTYDKY